MYRDLNDYEVLYLICDSNDDNYEIIQKKYSNLINKIINKYKYVVKKIGYEEEDLYQVCSMTLYQTIKYYDGDINNNLFYTYLLKSLENAIIGVIKINNTNKKKVLNESISYDNYIPNSNLTYADVFPDLSKEMFESFYNYELYLNYRNSFEFNISCILELRIEGYNNKEIATLLSMTYNEVTNAIKIIRAKIC